MSDPERTTPDTDVTDSNPNATGKHGTAGDMGLSSERAGADLSGIEGTGSVGDAVTGTTGTSDLSPHETEPTDPAQRPLRDGDEVPEPQPDNDVPAHPFDPARNPGHSSG